MRFVTLALVGWAVVLGAAVPMQITAKGLPTDGGHRTGQYRLVIVGNLLSGGQSFSNSINSRGWVSGFADVSSTTDHAAVWQGRMPTDLGTLGGANSGVAWPNKSNRAVSGYSDTSNSDPYGENFCDTTGDSCLGFVWSSGAMSALPTLGGNNAQATSVNSAGQVVGFSETTTQDASCIAPQVFDWNAFIWNKGAIAELPRYPGDVISAAVMVNQSEDAVGGSGPQCGPVSATLSEHAIVWPHRGTAVSLPTLGGTANNVAATINDNGEIAGFSDISGDTTGYAVAWDKHDRLKDLGALPGDANSSAYGINNRGQIVGASCTSGSSSCRAFIYQDDAMIDLNTLVSQNSGYYLVTAADINDSGDITGEAVDLSTGLAVVFVAIPNGDGAVRPSVTMPRVLLPSSVRHMLHLKALRHFGRAF